jgi:hypothetical protein
MALDWEELKIGNLGLVYLGGLDKTSLSENDTKFLNFRHFKL